MLKPYLRMHTIKYEVNKRVDNMLLKIARHMPARLRMWVVVDSANTSIFHIHPREDGYAGPDGLTFREIYDGALRYDDRATSSV
jgi:hypothetical protein